MFVEWFLDNCDWQRVEAHLPCLVEFAMTMNCYCSKFEVRCSVSQGRYWRTDENNSLFYY